MNDYQSPGAVPGEVGGIVVGVSDVVPVVGIGRGLHGAVVARWRVEVVVDGQADVAQVALWGEEMEIVGGSNPQCLSKYPKLHKDIPG